MRIVHSAKLTGKGQVTIPKAVREQLALETGDRVAFTVEDGAAELAKVADFLDLAGSVEVPKDVKGASWDEIRAAAGRAHVAQRRGKRR